jgi:hypothetical protein
MKQKTKSGNLKFAGKLLLMITFVLFMLSYFEDLIDMPRVRIGDIELHLTGILALLTGVTGVFLYYRGRQYSNKVSADLIINDSMPHVLYLRSFKADSSIWKSSLSMLWWANFIKGIGNGMMTDEEQLKDVLRPFGELIAIGHPGEPLPIPGASRMYASDNWKEIVRSQMQKANLVVIRGGIGDGLFWEFGQALEILNPEKLLILLHLGKKQYECFRQEVDRRYKISLPGTATIKRWGRPIRGLFSFSDAWVPTFLPLRAPFLRRIGYKSYRRIYKFALKPIYEKFGLEWQLPRISRLAKALIVFWSLFFAGLIVLLCFVFFNGQTDVGQESKHYDMETTVVGNDKRTTINGWKTLNEANYSIQYPPTWELDQSEEQGRIFSLLSPLESDEDHFRENIGLATEDLRDQDMDLDKYCEAVEEQLKKSFKNLNLIESETIQNGNEAYYKLILTFDQGVYHLKDEYYVWVENNMAYILVLVCEQNKFLEYKETGENILNSFSIKK